MNHLFSRRVRRPATTPIALSKLTLRNRALSRLLAILLASLSLVSCSEDTNQTTATAIPPTLRFTAIPDQNSTELEEKFQPLARYLSKQLGVRVRYVPARDYQASVEMFRNGDVQLGWFGGLTGVQAREAVVGATAIAQGAADPLYYSYIIAHRDTGLTYSTDLPANLHSLRFTFGSESSTSGRLMPEYYLRQHTGQDPLEYFDQPVGFSGSHDRTAELVASGQFQLGAINYKVYDQRVSEQRTNPNLVQVIWKSPPYADYNWTAHPNLEQLFAPGFTVTLQDALIQINDAQLLAALPRERLIKASNDDYEDIRQVAKQLNMIR